MRYYYNDYPVYVTAESRKYKASQHAAKMAKTGHVCCPVTIAGRKIAVSFWGKAWCEHMEGFHDYENRLPRGRTYVRNGSVFDLQIKPGEVDALVSGSDIYHVTIRLKPLEAKQWQAIRRRCAGQIASAIELLQGKFSDAVMKILTDRTEGMFPSVKDFSMDCSCPDSASMCKHIAAVAYGIGSRLDREPGLFFTLRNVNHLELVAAAGAGIAAAAQAGSGGIVEADLSAVFGIDMATAAKPVATAPPVISPKRGVKVKSAKPAKPAKQTMTKPQSKIKAKAGTKAKVKAKVKAKAKVKVNAKTKTKVKTKAAKS